MSAPARLCDMSLEALAERRATLRRLLAATEDELAVRETKARREYQRLEAEWLGREAALRPLSLAESVFGPKSFSR